MFFVYGPLNSMNRCPPYFRTILWSFQEMIKRFCASTNFLKGNVDNYGSMNEQRPTIS